MAVSTPTSPESAAASMTTKAFFMVDPSFLVQFEPPKGPPTLICRLNPKSISISGGGEWKVAEAAQQDETPPAQFRREKARSMSVELFFDHFELPSGDVSRELDVLFEWTKPCSHITGRQVSAAHLRFQWGAKRYFKCYIESISVNYTLFSRSGAPLRATVSLTLKEALEPLPGTNPTSGGEGGQRSQVVRAGDSIQSIAHRHYGDAALWRGVAAFNGIDDPLRIGTGTVVAVPDIETAEALTE